MEYKFYCFKELKYMPQPESSYWCWAACLSQMVIGLKAPSKFGRTQCELVSEYRSNFIDNHRFSCCTADNTIPVGCDLPLKETDLVEVYDKSGFDTEEIQILNLDDFEYIKTTLKKCQSPIVLKIRINRSAHMNLITGYGEKGDCKYVLVTDPQNSIGETYYKMDEFRRKIIVESAWTTEVKGDHLKTDVALQQSINFIDEFIEKYQNDIFEFSRDNLLNRVILLDPWSYLSHNEPSRLAQLINDLLNKNAYDKEELHEVFKLINENTKPKNDKNDRLKTFCWPYINKTTFGIRDLNYIDENLLRKKIDKEGINLSVFNRIKRGDAFTVLKNYAITIQLELKENIIYVKPVKYPFNYSLNTEWQSYNDFIYSLISLPTIEYFAEDRTRPIGGSALTM